jgi:hypothetical protein
MAQCMEKENEKKKETEKNEDQTKRMKSEFRSTDGHLLSTNSKASRSYYKE